MPPCSPADGLDGSPRGGLRRSDGAPASVPTENRRPAADG